jgi:hypothetical protein
MTLSIKKIIMVLGLCLAPVFSETLTVLNNQKTGNVYLNGVLIGSGDVSNFEIDPGKYVVTIKIDGNVSFKETIEIEPGKNQVLDTNTYVGLKNDSSIVDYGVKQIEEKRIRKATRGYFGIGGFFGGAFGPGVSVKILPVDRLAVQLAGWAEDQGRQQKTSVRYRLLYEFEETLLGKDALSIVYVGLGGGNYDRKNKSMPIVPLGDTMQKTINSLEGIIGLEFSFGNQLYWNLEVSLAKSVKSSQNYGEKKIDESMIETLLSFGAHFYFN